MKIEGYKCDGCGKTKGTTNHWFVIQRSPLRREDLRAPDKMKNAFQLFIMEFEWKSDSHTAQWHFCGEDCTLKFVSEFLAGGHQP